MLFIWLLIGCNKDSKDSGSPPPPPVYLEQGKPMIGMAEADIDFPIGAPMGGYTARCGYMGGAGKVDRRQSAYTVAFSPSAGIQTSAKAKALWLEAGNQDFVLLKADVIYSFDNLVSSVESRLEEELELENGALKGYVALTTSHTHNAPANFSDQIHFYLGGDRYNEEVFRRFRESLVDIALEAYQTREEVSLGISLHKDWDPNDQVYRDRRPENDELIVWDDLVGYGKDPNLWMMRIDRLDGSPIGMVFNFGIHGTSLGDENPLVSVDAPGHIEQALQERFDTPIVVMHTQGAGGDVTPVDDTSQQHPYAEMEGLGEIAADLLYEAWSSTPTSTPEMDLEMVSHSVPQGLDVTKVTRGGTVDWHYNSFDPNYVPDNIIYDDNGEIISPLDEFNAEFGGAFCGYDDPMISTGTIGAEVYPYDGCTQVDLISFVLNGLFGLDSFMEEGEAPLPLPSSLEAAVSTVRIGPLSITQDNETIQDNFLMGFFPGETTGMYAEQFRRRAKDELGFNHAMMVGYAQDHEGYLLMTEDWLLGGYEANINLWGPLQADSILDHALIMSEEHLHTDLIEPHDPNGQWQKTQYRDRELPTEIPDQTPAAGTAATNIPEDLWIPLDIDPMLEPAGEIRRIQDLAQFIWEGGDPGVDRPLVVLERENNGSWEEVQSTSGRSVTSSGSDFLMTHLPTPLYPYTDMQSHHYWIGWQAVGNTDSKMGLSTGTYRFHIYGHHYAGDENEVWPWTVEAYEITSPDFEVIPADLTLTPSEDLSTLSISLHGPDWGFRMIDLEGAANGANPPWGIELTWALEDGTTSTQTPMGSIENGTIIVEWLEGATSVSATDMYGNSGTWSSDEE
ncbi:MAG: hypothetical protein CMK59_09855 [Proteobacteria bacterium]|nr:hypothetical protein [Pseudomonadota bacterium]